MRGQAGVHALAAPPAGLCGQVEQGGTEFEASAKEHIIQIERIKVGRRCGVHLHCAIHEP